MKNTEPVEYIDDVDTYEREIVFEKRLIIALFCIAVIAAIVVGLIICIKYL